jgi:uncharacterized protein (TIGR02996 family)
MSDREAFVAAIAANPHDDLPRLVFADWLEEHGDPERAEFIRTQIRWHHADGEERKQLDERAGEMFREHAHRWLGLFLSALEPAFPPTVWADVQHSDHPAESIFLPHVPPAHYPFPPLPPPKLSVVSFWVRRGFATDFQVDLTKWEERGSLAEGFSHEPLIQLRCRDGMHSPQWTRFTDPCLRRITSLNFDQRWAWYDSAPESTAFLEDPHLAGVRDFSLLAVTQRVPITFPYLPVAWLERFVRSSLAYRLTGMSLCSVNSDGIRPLCRPGRLHLERLGLMGQLDGDSIRRLGASELSETVQELKLHFFGPDQSNLVAALARDDWRKLRRLDLSQNALRAAVLPALAAATFTLQLKKLDLSHNPLFDGTDLSGLQRLADALDPDRLEHLDLSDTGLSHVPDFLAERFGERVTV